MNIVIYARFSSHTQTEQSIEGQLKVCHEYARAHGFNVIEQYIDRAQSGTSDNRSSFQRMINDSVHHTSKAFWSTSWIGFPEIVMIVPYIKHNLKERCPRHIR